MWVLAQIWVIACVFGTGYAILRFTGDPQVAGVLGVVLGVLVAGTSAMLARDAIEWIFNRLSQRRLPE